MHTAWDAQLPYLVDAYLLWKHRPAIASEGSEERVGHAFHVAHIGVFGLFSFHRICYNLN